MKKGVIYTILFFLFFLAISPVMASSEVQQSEINLTTGGNHAIVIFDELCVFPDGKGGIFYTDEAKNIDTRSLNDNGLLSCGVKVAPGLYSEPEQITSATPGYIGVPCVTGSYVDDLPYPIPVYTYFWKITMSPGGHAELKCHFNIQHHDSLPDLPF